VRLVCPALRPGERRSFDGATKTISYQKSGMTKTSHVAAAAQAPCGTPTASLSPDGPMKHAEEAHAAERPSRSSTTRVTKNTGTARPMRPLLVRSSSRCSPAQQHLPHPTRLVQRFAVRQALSQSGGAWMRACNNKTVFRDGLSRGHTADTVSRGHLTCTWNAWSAQWWTFLRSTAAAPCRRRPTGFRVRCFHS